MAIPIILRIAVASQVVPLGATLAVRGRHPPAVYRRVAIWCCLLILFDVLSFVASLVFGENLWLTWFSEPIESAVTIWILMAWQASDGRMRFYRAAIPILLVVVAALLLLTKPERTFSTWIGPGIALVTLIAGLQTLIERTLLSREILTRQDWFWVCLGLTVFWACYVPVAPFARAMLTMHQDWVVTAYLVRAYVMVASFLVITWGILCTPRILSPGHS